MTSKIATEIAATVLTTACAAACAAIPAAQVAPSTIKPAELQLEAKWDKVFAQSSKVNHSKITFVNRYGITLAADLYVPKNAQGKLPAIAVSGKRPRKTSRDCRKRPLRCRQGTVLGSLRTDACRTRISHDCL